MRKKIIVILIIILLFGIIIFLNYPSLNNSQNDFPLDIPQGFSIKNSTDNKTVLTNSTVTLIIYTIKTNKSLNETIESHTHTYNISDINKENLKSINGIDVIKTKSKMKNETSYNIKYWFKNNKNTYNIHVYNNKNDTEEIILNMIDSIN